MSDRSPRPDVETVLAQRAWVRRTALALTRDPGTAEDLEQQALLRALERPSVLRSPRAWFATVLRRLTVDLHRAESRRRAREESVARAEAQASTAEAVARAEVLARAARAALELREPYRTVVVLRFFEGLPPAAIARRLEIPAETVKTRLRRALDLLRDRLDADTGEGGRRAWLAALLPDTAREVRPLLPGTASPAAEAGAWRGADVAARAAARTFGEVSAMAWKATVAAAAAGAMAVGAAWWLLPGEPVPPRGPTDPTGATPAVVAAAAGGEVPSAAEDQRSQARRMYEDDPSDARFRRIDEEARQRLPDRARKAGGASPAADEEPRPREVGVFVGPGTARPAADTNDLAVLEARKLDDERAALLARQEELRREAAAAEEADAAERASGGTDAWTELRPPDESAPREDLRVETRMPDFRLTASEKEAVAAAIASGGTDGPTTARIAGRVVDEDGLPLTVGFSVAMFPVGPVPEDGPGATMFSVRAGDGSFTTPPVRRGFTYDVLVRNVRGFLGGRTPGVAPGGEPVTVVIRRGGSLAGRVIGADGVAPAGAIVVSANAGPGPFPAGTLGLHAGAEVGPDGTFTLSGLGEHAFTVVAAGGNIRSCEPAGPVRAGGSVQVRALCGHVLEGRIAPWPFARVSGVSLVAAPRRTGDAAAGSDVGIVGADGRFRIVAREAGMHDLTLVVPSLGRTFPLGARDVPSAGVEIALPEDARER